MGMPLIFWGEIELEDNLKLYASVWEVDKNGEMVRTKMARL